MPYNFRKRTPIPEYQNHISYGNLKCKASCTHDTSLRCILCEKWFHYKCANLSKKAFTELSLSRRSFVCSNRCYNSVFPFGDLDTIDFLTTLIDPIISHPCRKCKKNCLGNQLMDCIQCDYCHSWYHFECTNIHDELFQSYVHNDLEFICSKSCEMGVFPFFNVKNSKNVVEFNPLKDCYPCRKCREECVTDCILCDVCDNWVHVSCTNLGDEFLDYVDNSKMFICSDRCQISLLPFNSTSLDNLFYYDTSTTTSDSQSYTDSNIIHQPHTQVANVTEVSKSFKSVYFDPFLRVNCSYICPTELKQDTISVNSLGIYHNNICSLNKNFHKFDDVFLNCPKPQIIAFSETRLNENSFIPSMNGYNFEHINSSSSAGGVCLYLKNTLNYKCRKDLSLSLNSCEDLWVEISSGSDSITENIVVGVIYRHPGHKYEAFCDRLCSILDVLNKSKKSITYAVTLILI